jgi:signal transduction histidine kinase
MQTREIVEQLKSHGALGDLPERELVWLAEHGTLVRYAEGTVLTDEHEEIFDSLLIVLSGHLALYVSRGGERRKVMERRAGDLGGLLPYSRMKRPAVDAVAVEETEALAIHRDLFPELIRECHEVTTRAVHIMVDRARAFTSADLHDEKMASLGRLAAGLAHELNNPAASLASNARALVARLMEAERASRAIGEARLDEAQVAAVDEVCLVGLSSEPGVLSPLERADREDAIVEWLQARGADTSPAEALADSAIDIESLERLGRALDGPSLEAAVRWIGAVAASRALALEIEEAASRIHELVQAVQGFTAMDRAGVVEPVDLGKGLTTSVRVLKAHARQKSVGVALEIERELPLVCCSAGELNQVWVNLVDNAIDAVGEGGKVTVSAGREGDEVVVRVVDDGPGIPEADREHIFEPFFTTKKVGEGTGLGLDIARRLVLRNEGEIEVDSRPGRTEFRVRLRIAGAIGDRILISAPGSSRK